MELVFHLSILASLFIISAFFSGTETALFSLSKIERRRLNENHPRFSKWINNHLDQPRRTLITILIGNLLSNTLATSLVALIVIEHFDGNYYSLVLALFTVLLILLTEIAPKTIAVRENETLSMVAALPLEILARLFSPVRWLIRRITDRILGVLAKEKVEQQDQISEEELKTLIQIGEEEGVLHPQEKQMIQKLLELGERQVKDIMIPRIEVAALDIDEPLEKQSEVIAKYHFAQFPVYKENVDHILGTISVQELMLDSKPMEQLLQQPLFVPETKKIDDLLAEFRAKNQNFAVCLDEYGGTAGIVTLEDILEEIFGEFDDEYTKVENPIRSLGHHEYIVEAKMALADFNEYFMTDLESQEASTLSGWLLEKLGELPEKGRVVDTPSLEIRIHDVIRHRRIKSVIVKKKNS